MPAIRTRRKTLGLFLLVGVPLVVTMFGGMVVTASPWWVYLFLLVTLVLPLSLLTYQFISDAPVLLIEDGCIIIPRLMLRPVRIPLSIVRHARMIRISGGDGEGMMLEVALIALPPELARFHNSFATRAIVKEGKFRANYQPPEEPFLLLQTQPLDATIPELNALIEAERQKAVHLAPPHHERDSSSSPTAPRTA